MWFVGWLVSTEPQKPRQGVMEDLSNSTEVDTDGNRSKRNNDAAAAAAVTDSTVADTDASAARAGAAPPAADDVAVAADPSHPLDEGGCFVCKKNDQLDLILLCDGCEGEYHTFCMQPPVLKIPKKEWFCDLCKAAGKGKAGPTPDPVSK